MIVWREKFVATGIHFLVTLALAAMRRRADLPRVVPRSLRRP